jgi:hypothetical protein
MLMMPERSPVSADVGPFVLGIAAGRLHGDEIELGDGRFEVLGELFGALAQLLGIVQRQQRALAHQLLAGVAGHGLGLQVHRGDGAGGVGGDDAEGGVLEDGVAELGDLAALGFDGLQFGQIGAGYGETVSQLDRVMAHPGYGQRGINDR